MKTAEMVKHKKTLRESLCDVRITLEYSIRLLQDYQGDLEIEVKDIKKTIRQATNKLKKMKEKGQ